MLKQVQHDRFVCYISGTCLFPNFIMSSRTCFGILPIGSECIQLARCWYHLEFSLRLRQSAFWIYFVLTELRLRGFAPCRLLLFAFRTRFTSSVRKSATFRKNFLVFTSVLFLLSLGQVFASLPLSQTIVLSYSGWDTSYHIALRKNASPASRSFSISLRSSLRKIRSSALQVSLRLSAVVCDTWLFKVYYAFWVLKDIQHKYVF